MADVSGRNAAMRTTMHAVKLFDLVLHCFQRLVRASYLLLFTVSGISFPLLVLQNWAHMGRCLSLGFSLIWMLTAGTLEAALMLIVCQQQLCICRRGFVHVMLHRAAGQENQMWKAMTYEVRPVRLKKNMSKPNWCTMCGPFEKPFCHGHSEVWCWTSWFPDVSSGPDLCKVRSLHSGGRRWLSALLIEEVQMLIQSHYKLSISLCTIAGAMNPLLSHSSCLQAWKTEFSMGCTSSVCFPNGPHKWKHIGP